MKQDVLYSQWTQPVLVDELRVNLLTVSPATCCKQSDEVAVSCPFHEPTDGSCMQSGVESVHVSKIIIAQ